MAGSGSVSADRPRTLDPAPVVEAPVPAGGAAAPNAPAPAKAADRVVANPALLPSNTPDSRATLPPSPGGAKTTQPVPPHVRAIASAAVCDLIKRGLYAEARTALQAQPFPDSQLRQQSTVFSQLEFQVAMSERGIKANMPPTLAQLKEYFSTMRGDTQAALSAYEQYCTAYQVHPSDAKLGHGIEYSNATVDVAGKHVRVGGPSGWTDVAPPKRVVVAAGEHAGKTVNDCEGFVLIATTLLGEAGLTVDNYASITDSKGGSAHALVVLRAGDERVVISNGGYYGPSDDPRNLLRRAWRGTGIESDPCMYLGSTPGLAAGRAATRTEPY